MGSPHGRARRWRRLPAVAAMTLLLLLLLGVHTVHGSKRYMRSDARHNNLKSSAARSIERSHAQHEARDELLTEDLASASGDDFAVLNPTQQGSEDTAQGTAAGNASPDAAPVSGAPTPPVTYDWRPADYDWPRFSSHTCAGVELANRTCSFSNLVYDKKEHHFLYYPDPQASAEDIALLKTLKFADNFVMWVTDAEFPTREMCCDEVEPIYLTNAYRPYSFGHTVRDFFFSMTANLHSLGLTHVTHSVILLEVLPFVGFSEFDVARGVRVLRKYSEWVGEGAMMFSELEATCNLNTTRYVLYRNVVAGSLLFHLEPARDLRIFPDRWGGCKDDHFRIQRDTAYQLARIKPVAAQDQKQVKILFGDKTARDSRRISNLDELIPALRERFPSYVIENKILSLLTAREQLEELSTATIFISPHASSSFRMAFVPDNAHTIIIGPPEMDGHLEKEAFIEIDVCWKHLNFMTLHKYHVTDREEYVKRFERGYQPDKPEVVEYYRWFDSDSKINVKKMGDLIEAAVTQIQSLRGVA